MSKPTVTNRSGITLTEVLISVFVLGAGLLGLAALVPLGQYHAIQANHQDRAAACGRWVFREFEAQGFLDVQLWATGNNGQVVLQNPFPRTVIFDPRLLANANSLNPGDVQAQVFPYAAPAANWNLQRITHAGFTSVTAANDLATWRDDVLFSAPNDNDRPGVVASAGQTAYDGDYSWIAMIRPAEQLTLPNTAAPNRVWQRPQDINTFVVSVIVMHNRSPIVDLAENVPSERQVGAAWRGPGWVELDASGGPIGRIAPNQWVMISARQNQPAGETGNPVLWFHRWYRVVNVTEPDPGTGNRTIKVAGPDWPAQLVNGNTTVCTIIDGAVGVYERPMIAPTGY